MSKNKIKLALERHLYAPELNKLHIIRNNKTLGILPAPNNTDFKSFFKKANTFVKNAFVTFKYKSDWSDRTYSGSFVSYSSLKKVLNELKSKHNVANEVTVTIKSGWI